MRCVQGTANLVAAVRMSAKPLSTLGAAELVADRRERKVSEIDPQLLNVHVECGLRPVPRKPS